MTYLLGLYCLFLTRKVSSACAFVLILSHITGVARSTHLYHPTLNGSQVGVAEICVNRDQINAVLLNKRIHWPRRSRLYRGSPVHRVHINRLLEISLLQSEVAPEFPGRGLTLSMWGLKYGYRGTINGKNFRKHWYHLPTEG